MLLREIQLTQTQCHFSAYTMPLHGGMSMDSKALAQRLHDFILTRDSVSMMEIYRLSATKYTKHEIGLALEKVHKMKDIERRIKSGDVLYSKKKPKVAALPALRYKPSPDKQASMDAEARDYWERSPLVTDQERVCYRDGFKTNECKELLWTPAERRYQEEKKYGPAAKRIREQEALRQYA